MAALDFDKARSCVLGEVLTGRRLPESERIELPFSAGRILAEEIRSDRDYPPFPRSVRDGFAVHAADLPGRVKVIGEVRAGERYPGIVGLGEAVEIMTGAPMPDCSDAVVMVEHVVREGEWISTDRKVKPGENFNTRGCETHAGDLLLQPGHRIDYSSVAMLATAGYTTILVYAKPRVAILSTGDEIVDVADTPLEHQIRNSNAYSLAVQVTRAGGVPVVLGVARDNAASTRELVAQGLEADLLLLSGGVSAGKYDIVEQVLAEFGAQFFFDRVLIQPGQPLVFGRAREKFFFGLPGNPASTMVTFELFGRAALELLGGASDAPLYFSRARLTQDFRHRPGLTRFLPACLSGDGSELTAIPWSGSGDVAALSKANAFLVAEPDRESWVAGEWIRVLRK
jgi:molybdopterin molybdotransferase